MRNKKVLILLYFILSISTFYVLTYDKEKSIEQYLDKKTLQYMENYKVLYGQNKTLSKLIYETKINIPAVQNIFKHASLGTQEQKDTARKLLYNYLSDTYAILNTYNVKQLHFHLPNNESFLRFHRPNKYGDNLTDFRESIKYTNEHQKPTDGFEEGKIYNGYRFVYPIFHQEKHIGSVEVSFSTLSMNIEFMRDHSVVSNFLIRKSVVEKKVFREEKSNYILSHLEDFYLEKAILQRIEKDRKFKTRRPVSQETKDIMKVSGLTEESFSLYDVMRKEVLTFIKVPNPISKEIVGIFVVISDAEYIVRKGKDFYLIFMLINLFIAIALYLIYKESKYKESIKRDNKELSLTVQKELDKNKEKDEYLLAQSRLAQMGELLSMIAHQWRQPLGIMSTILANLQIKFELNRFDLSTQKGIENHKEFLMDEFKSMNLQINNLSNTIEDFKSFYQPNKKSRKLEFKEIVQNCLKLLSSILKNNNIAIQEEYKTKQKLDMYENEMMQVIINIINNGQDNFKENNISNPKISIFVEENSLRICDNGGGIEDSILDQIFNPYFSTKKNKNGTGLGLYMSKIIVERHHGWHIEAKNIDEGACFSIYMGQRKEF